MSELNYEHVFNVLVDKTAEYVTSNNLKVMVLGISGGIDSTVVAAICHEVSKKTGIPLIGRWHKGSVILCDYKFLMVVSGEETPQDLPENVHVVYVPQITICSTCIRNRVKLGVYIQPFVKDTVEAFIDQYRLYV